MGHAERHRTTNRWRRLFLPTVALSVLGLGVFAVPAASSPAATAPAVGAATSLGSDISWPQCGGGYPPTPAFGIVGANDGRPDTANPCLASEARWASASKTVEFYMNTADPPEVAPAQAYQYGFAAAQYAYTYANRWVAAGPGHMWWLDVETGNSWGSDQGANTEDIAGSIAFFRSKNVEVGVYSTAYQWGLITGGASIPSVPNWVPGASSAARAPAFCQASFSGGPVMMTQFTSQFDYDALCPGVTLPAPLPPPPSGLAGLLTAVLNWLKGL